MISLSVDALGDEVAGLLVDVAPVLERAHLHGLGHVVTEVPDDGGHEPGALGVVHDLAHKRARLAPVVVVFAQRVGGLRPMAEAAGFKLERRDGPPFAFQARFIVDEHANARAQ